MTISVSLGLLSYVLAMVTASYSRLGHPLNIVLLAVALLLIPVFGLWMRRQERLNKPAIIPNSLWRDVPFTTVCIAVFLTWGVFNSVKFQTTLYFQRVQGLSALQASIRFLPSKSHICVAAWQATWKAECASDNVSILIYLWARNVLKAFISVLDTTKGSLLTFDTASGGYWCSNQHYDRLPC